MALPTTHLSTQPAMTNAELKRLMNAKKRKPPTQPPTQLSDVTAPTTTSKKRRSSLFNSATGHPSSSTNPVTTAEDRSDDDANPAEADDFLANLISTVNHSTVFDVATNAFPTALQDNHTTTASGTHINTIDQATDLSLKRVVRLTFTAALPDAFNATAKLLQKTLVYYEHRPRAGTEEEDDEFSYPGVLMNNDNTGGYKSDSGATITPHTALNVNGKVTRATIVSLNNWLKSPNDSQGLARAAWQSAFRGAFTNLLEDESGSGAGNFYSVGVDQSVLFHRTERGEEVVLSSATKLQRKTLQDAGVAVQHYVNGAQVPFEEATVDGRLAAHQAELQELSNLDGDRGMGINMSALPQKGSSDDPRVFISGFSQVVGFYEVFLNTVGFLRLRRASNKLELPTLYTSLPGLVGFEGKKIAVSSRSSATGTIELKGRFLPFTLGKLLSAAAATGESFSANLRTLESTVSPQFTHSSHFASTAVFCEGGPVHDIEWHSDEGRGGFVENGNWGEVGVVKVAV